MEVGRGVVTILFALLVPFTPSIFIGVLGVYLVLDGALDLYPTTRRAVVFIRRAGANGLGHIGWAFEWANGWFNAGSVENEQEKPFAGPQEMGFWSAHTLDPIGEMQQHYLPYNEYKVLYVLREPTSKKAL